MSTSSCSRTWEVEAARDGRLTGAELASFERHASSCAACRAEAAVIDSLRQSLRALREPVVDEVAIRRRKLRLLREADETAMGEVPSRSPLRHVFAVAGAISVLALGGLSARAWIAHRAASASSSTTSAAAPQKSAVPLRVAVSASFGAKWSRTSTGSNEDIRLDDGELAIDVAHQVGVGRLVVKLPDGELQDIGTRFVVAVRDGRTSHVSVGEGVVSLRLLGHAPIQVVAGSSWHPESDETTSTNPAASAATIATTSAAAPTTAVAHKPSPPKSKAASAGTTVDPATTEFHAAMSMLRSGDATAAATKFHTFVVAHPGDPRSEDASYLEILSLQRAGDHAAARAAAGRYLTRYPAGFRRAEVEAIAR